MTGRSQGVWPGHLVAPGRLGAVERLVSFLEQGFEITLCPRIQHGQTNADGDDPGRLRVQVFDGTGCHRSAHALGHLVGRRAAGRRQQHAKFFTADARRQVSRPAQLRLQGLGHRNKALVTHGVSVVVVEVLEAIDIADQQGQTSLLALGAMEQAAAWRRVGDLQLAARFQAYAVRIGRNVVQWGTVRASFGSTLPLTGVRWSAGGAAQLSSYYTYPRAGAGEAPGPGVDMLVGTPGWWTWFAGSLAAAQVGPQDDVRARAAAIWAEQTVGQQSVEALEWWAVR